MTLSCDIRIREATDADKGRWNSYIDDHAISPLARYEWKNILSGVYGVPTTFLIAENSERIKGVFGGYEISDWSGARRFYSLRVGGNADDEETADAMRKFLENKGVEQGWCDAVISSGNRPWGGLKPDYLKKTVWLDIDEDEARMWSGLRDKTRNMVRRAERKNVVVISGDEYAQSLYEHYRENMSRLGVVIHAQEFFTETIRQLGSSSKILVAVHENRMIASMLLLLGRDIACYPVQNATAEARSLAPIQLLNWEAMKLCSLEGIKKLDMGESSVNSPVYKSKINFGGQPAGIHYYKLSTCNEENDPTGSFSRISGRTIRTGFNIACKFASDGIRPLLLERLHRRGRLF